MTPSVCEELLLASDLAPAMVARLMAYDTSVLAYDACTTGYWPKKAINLYIAIKHRNITHQSLHH